MEHEEIIQRLKKEAGEAESLCKKYRKEKIQANAESESLRDLLLKTKQKAYEAVVAEIDAANARIDQIIDGLNLMFGPKLNDAEKHSLLEFLESKKRKKVIIQASESEP